MGTSVRRRAAVGAAAVLALAAVGGIASARQQANFFTVHPLVSDAAAVAAPGTDASLVNGWGLSAGPTTPWWAANNGSNTSTLYNGVGAKTALTVSVAGGPTGTVFNGNAAAFVVSQAGKSAAARFLFATEGGTIMGWSPTVNGTVAVTGADRSAAGAIYKGLAIANDHLYATDFHNGRVDVFDQSFNLVTGGFTDPKIPAGLRPVRDPGARREHLRHLREAGCREEGRRRAPRPGLRRRVHAGRGARRAGRELPEEERAAERGVGARARPGGLRHVRGLPPRRQLRQRPDQRLHEAVPPRGSTRASCATPTGARSSSTGSGRSRSATAAPQARRAPSTSSPDRRRRRTASSARSPSAESHRPTASPAPSAPTTRRGCRYDYGPTGRSGRVAEGGALLRRYGGELLHRGFESLLLR